VATTALAGAKLAEWKRQREEERRRAEEAQQQKRENTEKRKAQKKAEDAVRERWAEDARQERANDASTARWEGLAKQEEAKKQAKINDANAARWAGVAAIAQSKEEEKKAGASKVVAKPVPVDDPPGWMDFLKDKILDVKEWVNTTVIQPVKGAYSSTVSAMKDIATAAMVTTQKIYEDSRDKVKENWNAVTGWVDDHFVQPIKNTYEKAAEYIKALPTSLPDKLSTVVRDVAIYTIPRAAELIYQNAYLPAVSFSEEHPYIWDKAVQTINYGLDYVAKPILNNIVDTNPDTMNWFDLGVTWLFELGDQSKDEIVFDADSNLVQDLTQHTAVQGARDAAIEKITEGRLEEVLQECIVTGTPIPDGQYPVCLPNQYGVSKYFQSLDKIIDGDLSEVYLGSYTVTINVEPAGDGAYIFNYQIKNPSTWESATRFRIDSPTDGDSINEGFIPDTSLRRVGIKLGGKLDQTFEWSEEIQIPNGE
jgi:hypothetical protein